MTLITADKTSYRLSWRWYNAYFSELDAQVDYFEQIRSEWLKTSKEWQNRPPLCWANWFGLSDMERMDFGLSPSYHTSHNQTQTLSIDEIKSAVDFMELASNYGKITKRGVKYFMLCPFVNEKTPSLCIDPVKKLFYCFSCTAHGSVIDFVMQAQKLSFKEALGFLAAFLYPSM